MKGLGDRQKRAIIMLAERGTWSPGCGWYVGDNASEGYRILNSLKKQGLVRSDRGDYFLTAVASRMLVPTSPGRYAFEEDA